MTDQAGSLHDRLNRISHWDVNVTDLERSRSWYEATTTLKVVTRTKASQCFSRLRHRVRQLQGYLLKDANLPRGVPMIHLVQWENPTPIGTPYRSQANVGWYRICPIVDDIETTRGAVIAQGSKPFAPTTRVDRRCSVPLFSPSECDGPGNLTHQNELTSANSVAFPGIVARGVVLLL
jgi:catechol 2,3-dioxygenase-like lactoylglutathione lyase family enzyme